MVILVPTGYAAYSIKPQSTAVPDPIKSKSSTCGFEEMQLHVGDRMQIELPLGINPGPHFTTLIGYLPGHSVLLRTPLLQNLPIPIREGEQALVRTFSGQNAYTFESLVERVNRVPFPYLHLSYPHAAQRTVIRGALRVRVSLAATIGNPARFGDALPTAATIVDLSNSGALVEAGNGLGEAGDTVELAFKFVVQPNDYEVKLVTPAEIQSARRIAREDGGEVFSYGIRFATLRATESLLLQSFVQQVLLADRSRVV